MSLKQLFQLFILYSIVLTILLFLSFCYWENGDMNTVLFGTILYIPYVFLFSGVNLILIGLGLIKITKRPLVFLTAFFTSIILIIWLLLNSGQVTIRYWNLTPKEFVLLNIVFVVLNFLTVASLTSRK